MDKVTPTRLATPIELLSIGMHTWLLQWQALHKSPNKSKYKDQPDIGTVGPF